MADERRQDADAEVPAVGKREHNDDRPDEAPPEQQAFRSRRSSVNFAGRGAGPGAGAVLTEVAPGTEAARTQPDVLEHQVHPTMKARNTTKAARLA
jgi:hypothetical protein